MMHMECWWLLRERERYEALVGRERRAILIMEVLLALHVHVHQ